MANNIYSSIVLLPLLTALLKDIEPSQKQVLRAFLSQTENYKKKIVYLPFQAVFWMFFLVKWDMQNIIH